MKKIGVKSSTKDSENIERESLEVSINTNSFKFLKHLKTIISETFTKFEIRMKTSGRSFKAVN